MKSYSKALLLLLLALTYGSVRAQERELTYSEFNAISKPVWQNTATKPRRVITRDDQTYVGPDMEVITNGVWTESVYEFVPPNSRHYASTNFTRTKTGVNANKLETFSIGDRTITRRNDGEWRELKQEQSTVTGKSSNSAKPVHKYLRTEDFNNQKADVYEISITYYHPSEIENQTPESRKMPATVVYRYWFGHNNLVLKHEVENVHFSQWRNAANELRQSKNTSLQTRIFEYDPNLKIEFPDIMKLEQK